MLIKKNFFIKFSHFFTLSTPLNLKQFSLISSYLLLYFLLKKFLGSYNKKDIVPLVLLNNKNVKKWAN